MMLSAPAHADGPQNITITDPVSGASTLMAGALVYGAAASDNIVLIYPGNPQTPVGTQAARPVAVRVVAADGVTPIAGATVGWTTTNSLQLSACSGNSSCSVTTDQNGTASTSLTPAAAGVATVTATLAPGVYSPAKSVTATLNATQSSSDIGVSTPYFWISQGATVTVPLTARALSNGVPRNGAQVNFTVVNGAGTLTAASAQTNSSGYASLNLSVTRIAGLVQVSACVAPGNAPCAMFYANPVPLAQQKLLLVAGGGQVSTGQAFQPLVVRVVDSSSPANPVIAAPVAFQTTVLRPGGTSPAPGDPESSSGNPAMPVILQVAQSSTTTDANGLANIVPARSGFSPPLEVDVAVTAGTTALLDFPLQVLPAPTLTSSPAVTNPEPVVRPVRPPLWRRENDR